MVERGVLINYLAPSWSHTQEHVEQTLAAASESMRVYARALEDGIGGYLRSEVVKPVFRKFN
jgi:glutamate-1-semialdehyde 2,1-aminomutase